MARAKKEDPGTEEVFNKDKKTEDGQSFSRGDRRFVKEVLAGKKEINTQHRHQKGK